MAPTVKIFANLTLHGKILAHDVMQSRNMNMNCAEIVLQNRHCIYFFCVCPYAVEVLMKIREEFRCQIMWPGLTVQVRGTGEKSQFHGKKGMGCKFYLGMLTSMETEEHDNLW